MNKYTRLDMEIWKVMKLVDNIHEIMDYIDDGYHNSEISYLVAISNELISKVDKMYEEAQ